MINTYTNTYVLKTSVKLHIFIIYFSLLTQKLSTELLICTISVSLAIKNRCPQLGRLFLSYGFQNCT